MLLLFAVVCWFLRQPHLQMEESRAGEMAHPVPRAQQGRSKGKPCWHESARAAGKGCPASPPVLPGPLLAGCFDATNLNLLRS